MTDVYNWPVLTSYDQDHLSCISLPLGGIGTGTVSLGGRGDLRYWEIVNRPNKEFNLRYTFFSLYTKPHNGPVITKALEGRFTPPYEGPFGCSGKNAGLPRFQNCSFQAAYPLGQVLLSDPDVPVDVRLMAFNPLVPGNVDASSIPMAVMRFVLTNKLDVPVEASICGSMTNFIGTDGISGSPKQNRNQFKQTDSNGSICGIYMHSLGVDPTSEQFGTMCLATTDSQDISYRTAWADYSWADSLLDFWDDFSSDGRLDERDGEKALDSPQCSLTSGIEIPAQSSRSITFVITWHFPNRKGWNQPVNRDGIELSDNSRDEDANETIGNYYTTKYKDAWDVVVQSIPGLPELEKQTVKFVDSFCSSDLPETVKVAALNNLSTLRTQTCFRAADGHFFGWEGCGQTKGWQSWEWGQRPLDLDGSCYGSCTHVWNYEQVTPFLFGELATSMREIEFLHATRHDGFMSFRVNLPLERATEFGVAAADGQMGCIMKLYRDWQLSGNDTFLEHCWPKAKKALEFCWVSGGWDADQDGVMEGCQHNTMDVEYFGPNPQMGIWYLGALRAAEKMALYLEEYSFARNCRELFEQGRDWIEKHLFNGEYFEQIITPPDKDRKIYPGLMHDLGGGKTPEPVMQLGAGCLIDQLVGQYMAHVCGLGYLLNKSQVQTTLKSIMKYNFKNKFNTHFNHMRTFTINDESGILMATFPRGNRPERPFPYYNEVMSGFEYTAAAGMMFEGQLDNALICIKAIRDRHDGKKRNPFDEAECGHHYVRAMASWAAVLAYTGFHYSAVSRTMTFAAKAGQCFWSTGYAWGTLKQQKAQEGIEIEFKIDFGQVKIQKICLKEVGQITLPDQKDVIDAPYTFKGNVKPEKAFSPKKTTDIRAVGPDIKKRIPEPKV